jgi:hypothetical protein
MSDPTTVYVGGGVERATRASPASGPTPAAPSPTPLSEKQLATVRLLAQEGNREIVMRQVLGISARAWRELKAVEDSPLMEALEAGRAEGAGLVITFMRERMSKNNSMEAAKWLGEHVYGITKPAAGEGVGRTTHVLVLPAPMSDEEWARVQRGGRVYDVTPEQPKQVTHVER